MLELVVLVVVGTSIWVLFDAPARGLSWTWGLGCLALWILAFPWYLVERSKTRPPAPVRTVSARPAGGDPTPVDLERLADLRDRGVLTPEQFEGQKRQLMERRGR